MVNNPSDDLWICTLCEMSTGQPASTPGVSSDSGLSCVCFNARSILLKRFDLLAFLCAYHFDVVSITETFLDSTVPDAQIISSGYNIFRKDRNRHGGGMLVMVRDSITVVRRYDLEVACEMLWLELYVQKGVIDFLTYYRPPTTSVDSLLALYSALAVVSTSRPIFICGDFNVPHINWQTLSPTFKSPVADTLCRVVCDNFLSQVVHQCTRDDHILDLLLTNNPALISSVDVIDSLPGCDHDAIQFTLLVSLPKQSATHRRLYNYKAINVNELNEVLFHVPWNVIDYHHDDIELSWSQWKHLFFSAIDYVVPTIRWSRYKLKHWFSRDTIKLIHQKKTLYHEYKNSGNPTLLKKYRSHSNLVRMATRRDTARHSDIVSRQCHSNPKQFWQWINSLKGYRSPIPPLHDSGAVFVDDSDKATLFNNYFCSVFTKENCSNLHTLTPEVSHPTIVDSFTISPEDVHIELCRLNTSKSCGPDSITPFLLRTAAEHISVPLSHLFNQSLLTGTLPFDWVSANIVPIYKRNDKHIPGNYRPISLTSKVFERILFRHLVSALESHHLLSPSQFGFRAGRSTVSLLVDAVDDWSLCLEQHGTVHCLLLDFAKAFDSVPHERLLLKLSSLGIHGCTLQWLRFFLTQKKQRVVINGVSSDWADVISGVPQGSVLGPLLFVLYINDLESVVKRSVVKLFADDVLLYASVHSPADCSALQDDLAAILHWTNRWQLRLNPSKCEALAITNKRNQLTYTYHIKEDCFNS